jgi:nucleotide-binding universal stress UspA family protein
LSAPIGPVHVVDPKLAGDETVGPADQMWASLRTEGQGLLDTAASAVAERLHSWAFRRQRAPWEPFTGSAREWAANLMVAGTHVRSGLTLFLFERHGYRHGYRRAVEPILERAASAPSRSST